MQKQSQSVFIYLMVIALKFSDGVPKGLLRSDPKLKARYPCAFWAYSLCLQHFH